MVKTSEPLQLMMFQMPILSLEDFLVQLSAMLEKKQDSQWKTQEVRSFLRSHGFAQRNDPEIYYSKMLKVYLVTTMEKLSRQSLGFLPTWGIELNGRYLTARTSGFLKTGSEYSLSDILEEQVDDKYFLSQDQMGRLEKRAKVNKEEGRGFSPTYLLP